MNAIGSREIVGDVITNLIMIILLNVTKHERKGEKEQQMKGVRRNNNPKYIK
jgi:hypothetical protein